MSLSSGSFVSLVWHSCGESEGLVSGAALEGRLTLAGNVLGRQGHLDPRACAALREADLVVFEEARPARQALKAAAVRREFLLVNEHDSNETLQAVEHALRDGQHVAYMSDQGMPNVADPGYQLSRIAYRLGAHVEVVSGPTSLTSAIAAFPFPCPTFRFAGFPPRQPRARDAWLAGLDDSEPQVILEAPYRWMALLEACARVLSARPCLLARDIDGEVPSNLLGTPGEIARQLAADDPIDLKRTNAVLVISARAGSGSKALTVGDRGRKREGSSSTKRGGRS